MSASAEPPASNRVPYAILLAIILAGITVRLAVLLRYPGNMLEDTDAYLGIAQSVVDGRGFSSPGSATPTAFRPPLYPLLLAASGPANSLGRCVLHLVLSALMLTAIWQTGRQLQLSVLGCGLATLLAAYDPLLIWYGSYPMTETLCSALSAFMLLRWTSPESVNGKSGFVTGVLFGLCVLARPTYWPWGVLAGLWFIARCGWSTSQTVQSNVTDNGRWKIWAAAMGGVLLCVTPWVVRNWYWLETPILMTTHGGYTLRLANNESFYREEVNQPWGTIWTGNAFDEWTATWQQELADAGVQGEIETDRWQSRKAKEFISQHPRPFLKACVHRVRMFWNIKPVGDLSSRIPSAVLFAIGVGYTVWWVLALVGLIKICRQRLATWVPVLLLLFSFTVVHAVYWSNMRLRAPVVPGVALLAGLAVTRNNKIIGESAATDRNP
ncbi:MAG: hypothetical protein KDA69_06450 [Planctomycetaceae bacterium]|nr:hypothetical protein [Planctomycetaceae bacterium]